MAHTHTSAREPVLVTRGLTKRYGETAVVDEVDLELRRGGIYGLIGPNGAGKTSLMRLVCGLSTPTSGRIELFGSRKPTELARQRARLGVLIEEPGLNRTMTAAENLDLHRVIRGVPSRTLTGELLELVGLQGTGRKRAQDFSLGMRQRLGIAIALVANPELLLLDEPVNGLDPRGVVEMRELFRRLAETRDLTILISSHNLPELYQTATDYVIIDRGRVREAITLADLEQRMQHSLRIGCTDTARLTATLETLGLGDIRVLPDGTLRVLTPVPDLERLLRDLVSRDLYPTTFVVESDTLEGYFLSVIGGR